MRVLSNNNVAESLSLISFQERSFIAKYYSGKILCMPFCEQERFCPASNGPTVIG
jgi:hypothetical protein